MENLEVQYDCFPRLGDQVELVSKNDFFHFLLAGKLCLFLLGENLAIEFHEFVTSRWDHRHLLYLKHNRKMVHRFQQVHSAAPAFSKVLAAKSK